MKALELGFFSIAALFVLLGGVFTVGARNPIRSAMGLLTTIIGIACLYLMLSAEFLAAIQILVYAGAIVILFIFVIMLLGPSASSPRDARTAVPRYIGAAVFIAGSLLALLLVARSGKPEPLVLPAAPQSLGTIEALGLELFTRGVVPFELSGALLLVAVVGAVAVARGKQVDPTLMPAAAAPGGGAGESERRLASGKEHTAAAARSSGALHDKPAAARSAAAVAAPKETLL